MADVENRDVECAAAKVVDRDLALEVLAKPIGKRGRGRLVDDADNVEASDTSRVFRRLALVVVEVRRDRDHGLLGATAEVLLGDELHLLEDERADFRDAVDLIAKLDAHVTVRAFDDPVRAGLLHRLGRRGFPATSDQALGRIYGVLGVRDRLTLRDVSDETLTALGDRDHRRRGLVATLVRDDRWNPIFDDGDASVRGSEVDTNDVFHECSGRTRRSKRQAAFVPAVP